MRPRTSTANLASLSPEKARNLLRERQRLNRLAAKELRVKYPQFATLRVDLVFNDESPLPPAPQSIVLYPSARAYFVYPCPYASCSGELNLASNVDDIAAQGTAGAVGHARCSGERHGPNGKAPCVLHIRYSIAVGK